MFKTLFVYKTVEPYNSFIEEHCKNKTEFVFNFQNFEDFKFDYQELLNYDLLILDKYVEKIFDMITYIKNLDLKIILIIIGDEFNASDKIKFLQNHTYYLDITKPAEFNFDFLKKLLCNKINIIIENPKKNWFDFTISSIRDFSNEISEFIAHLSNSASLSEDDLFKIQFVLREIQDNAIEHAHKCDEQKKIKISSVILDDCIIVKVEDEGEGFNSADLTDPLEDLDKSVKERTAEGKRPGGLGIAMAKRVMDSVTFSEKGNTVIMTKYFNLKKTDI
ncbi:MAG TPA: ATP-binding protein [bacterium]|nr:ATP-binding protein [bacterium]HPN30611.1 ATP-binding protein [bacterium]